MRSNLPVTPNEVKLTERTLIVSRTDLQGRITYVNKDFLDISGFTEAELIGEPHNMVRHPDMPAEAFEDMWRDLKAGRPWTGYVKNRCKNGDFYWVLANATPIFDNGQVSGYLSVRRKVEDAAIPALDDIYRKFREGKAGSLRISHGEVVKGSGGGLKNVSLGIKLGALLAFLVVTLIVQAVIGLYQVSITNDVVGDIFARRTEPTRIIGRISKLMADNRSQVLLGLQHDPSSPLSKMHDHPASVHNEAVQKNIAEITSLWATYDKLIQGDEHRKLADDYVASRKKFVQEGLLPATKALEQSDYEGANLIILKNINPFYNEASGKADLIAAYLAEQSKKQFAGSQAQFEQVRTMTVGVLLLVLMLVIGVGIWLVRSITRPLSAVLNTLTNVTQGNYSNKIEVSRDDEIGKVLQGLQTMQTRLGFEVTEAKRQADEMTRIKIALDSVSTPVRIADPAGMVIYANQTLKETLRRIEPVLKAQNPKFSVDGFVGSSIGNLYADPDAALKRLGSLEKTVEVIMDIGGRTYRVITSPVFTEAGERLGSVGEWQDRTDQLAVEREINGIVEGAARGDLTGRVDPAGKDGFFLALAQGINGLLVSTQDALQATSEVLSRVAQGDLTQTITAEYSGIFGQLKDDTNTTIERLREVVGRIKEASELISTASQEIAAGNTDLSSRTEEQASSLEETASSMEQLNATVRQNAENAKQANEHAKNSNEIATRGGQMVKQVVQTMTGIQDSSKKIADIIGVIDSIAFQTNILALNAAVEAARAGEQGRGFAVVATEVRNLAQRSATAAKEIKELIAESVGKVDAGTRLVDQAGDTMDDVVSSFQQVANLVTEISNASREQSSGIEQVTQAVSQMDEVTQQNAALVEQAAAAAESLEEQARGLVQSVGMFQLASGQGGRRATTTMPGPALRDATPKQLGANPSSASKVGGGGTAKKAPAHLLDDGEQWEEF